MPAVVFAAPFAMGNTMRFVRAVGALPGVRLGLLSQDSAADLPADVRRGVTAFHQVEDAFDAGQLAEGIRALARSWGGHVDRAFGILEQVQEPLAVARERLGIPGLAVEAARSFRNKTRMKDVLRQHDLPCARHCQVDSAAQALAFARDCGLPLVLKPPAGAGAKNTFRVDTLSDLEGYLRTSPPRPEAPLLLEEFITGREFSYDSASLRGEHVFASISSYAPTPLDVMRQPWIQWCVLLPRSIAGDEFADIRRAGPRALAALGMQTGITHLEWFRRDDGSIAISEVAARPPGAQFMSLMSYAHDFDFYRGWAELMVFERFLPPQRQYAVGAAYLRGQGRGKVVAIRGLEQLSGDVARLIVEAELPEPGHVPSESYEGDGFVILRHPDTATVAAGLQQVVSRLRVELG